MSSGLRITPGQRRIGGRTSAPVPARRDHVENMDFVGGGMMLIEEDVPVHREHPHPALEDRTCLGKGAEGRDQTSLDPLQEIQNGRNAVHVHMIDELDQSGIDPGGEEDGDSLHGSG